MFADADGDGKRKLMAYHFGPKDALQVKSSVYVKRTKDGAYEVRANVPCTVTLPGNAKAATISIDGRRFAPIPKGTLVDNRSIRLDGETLKAGRVWLKLPKSR